MNVLVVTNNPGSRRETGKTRPLCRVYGWECKRSLLHARDLIIKAGIWLLIPEAATIKDIIPCHTVILCVTRPSALWGEDVLVLEKLAQFHDSPYRPDAPFTRIWSLRTFKYWTCRLLLRTTEHLKCYMDELSYKRSEGKYE